MTLPLLIFDFDGTIADSVGHIVATMQAACAAMGAPIPSPVTVKSAMGLSIDETVAKCLPGADADLIHRTARRYEQEYRDSQRNHVTHLFPGMLEMLTQLSAGNTLAIATGKTRMGLNAVLANLPELARLFSSLHTASDGPGKPHPAMIEAALEANRADRTRTLMVGDATFDMEMARAAGVLAIGVTWGTADHEGLVRSGAYVVAQTVQDLEKTIGDFLERL